MRARSGDLELEVDSAGTADIGARPSTPEAIETASTFGIDLTGHLSKPLSAVDASGFDLVVGFERNHVAAAVVEAGAAADRAFVLPELDRLLRSLPVLRTDHALERARTTIRHAHEARGVDFVPGEEVDDPIGRSMRTYARVFTEIHDLTSGVASVLLGRADGMIRR